MKEDRLKSEIQNGHQGAFFGKFGKFLVEILQYTKNEAGLYLGCILETWMDSFETWCAS
jgi:hypothetical protein